MILSIHDKHLITYLNNSNLLIFTLNTTIISYSIQRLNVVDGNKLLNLHLKHYEIIHTSRTLNLFLFVCFNKIEEQLSLKNGLTIIKNRSPQKKNLLFTINSRKQTTTKIKIVTTTLTF